MGKDRGTRNDGQSLHLIYGTCDECGDYRPVFIRSVVVETTMQGYGHATVSSAESHERRLCIDCARQHDTHRERVIAYLREGGE